MGNTNLQIPNLHLKVLYWLVKLHSICGDPLEGIAIAIRARCSKSTVRKVLIQYPKWVTISRESIIDGRGGRINYYEPRVQNIPVETLNYIKGVKK